jgi:phosphohistidine phosphatase
MVRELFLVRHAEAETANYGMKDVERSLTPDGEVMASKMGKFLAKVITSTDHILSSISMRTRQTTALLAEQLQYNPVQVEFTEELYEASTRILLRVINGLSDEYKKVVIVGHNPSITYLAEYVTGNEIGNVTPAGIVHLKLKGSWAEVSEKNMDLLQYYDPAIV